MFLTVVGAVLIAIGSHPICGSLATPGRLTALRLYSVALY
uniref:AHA11 n=1 Tax=Arundo donax TaxID=35708 RepID=A0A0A9EBW2_ARUDO